MYVYFKYMHNYYIMYILYIVLCPMAHSLYLPWKCLYSKCMYAYVCMYVYCLLSERVSTLPSQIPCMCAYLVNKADSDRGVPYWGCTPGVRL